MPLTRVLVVALSCSLSAWGGWSLGRPWGVLAGFLLANPGFALGWYLSRSFVRNNFD